SAQEMEESRGMRSGERGAHRLAARADPMPGGHRLGDESHEAIGFPKVRGILRRSRVWIVGGGEGDPGAKGIEWVASAWQRAQKRCGGSGKSSGPGEARQELRPLPGGRQVAEPEQSRHVLEAHRVCQIADLVAAVVEPPCRSVDLADG